MKKLLAILLSLAVIFAMLPAGVFADETGDQPQGGSDINAGDDSKPEIDPDTVHLNGVTEKNPGSSYDAAITFADNVYYYRTISDAFKDAIADDVVTLQRSIALSENLYLYTEVPVTLDLAGQTLTCGSSRVFTGYDGEKVYSSDITFTDTKGGGKIYATANQVAVYVSSGRFTFSGGSIVNTYSPEKTSAYGIYAKRNSEVNITAGSVLAETAVMAWPATVNITGGIIQGTYQAGLRVNGDKDTQTGSVANIYGGYISCFEYAGIYGDDSATVNFYGGYIYGKYGIYLYDKSEVTVNGGEIQGRDASAAVARKSKFTLNDGTLDGSVITEYEGATFVMNGGSVKTAGSDIAIMGNAEEGHGGVSIVINGGTITSDATAMYLPQSGTTTIKGGSITGAAGIEIKSGRLEISPISDDALTIEAVGVPYSGGSPDSNLNNEDGAAVAVTGDAKYTGDIDVNISGGTFNSTYGIAFWAYNSDGSRCIKNLDISGGIFTGGKYNSKKYSACAAYNAKGFVRGGSFNTDPATLVARGSFSENSGSSYEVKNGVTFKGEKSDIATDEASGNTTKTITRTGTDAASNSVQQITRMVTGKNGEPVKNITETSFEYEKNILTIKTTAVKGEAASSEAIVEIKGDITEEALSDAKALLKEAELEIATTGGGSVQQIIRLSTDKTSLAVKKSVFNSIMQTGMLEVQTSEGTYRFNAEEMKLIADKAAGDSITLSSESVEIVKRQRINKAKAAEPSVSSISRKNSLVTVKWNKKDGVDGYILKLVTDGKTYTQKITDATVSEFTFSQKVTKSYRVKAASVTEVDGQQVTSSYSYKTSVVKPTVSKISKASKTKKVTVKWKRMSSADGFRVRLVYKGKTTTKYISNPKAVSYTFNKKVTGAYKVKISSYSNIEGKKAYSTEKTFSRK